MPALLPPKRTRIEAAATGVCPSPPVIPAQAGIQATLPGALPVHHHRFDDPRLAGGNIIEGLLRAVEG
ncbi:MAG TPA: hypothetical protein PLT86_04405, partial [Candidatus Latescibacteria bacterium]|nr:hypothetical protein [Candidatus Latescibacterota bacterium]